MLKPDLSVVCTYDTCEECVVCHRNKVLAKLIICDKCDCAYHWSCVHPPITSLPSVLRLVCLS